MSKDKKALSPKKEAMLIHGKRLILTQGYTATSVDQICEESGMTKGAFYYFFKSKDNFALELLEYNWQPMVEMQAAFAEADIDPLKHLYQHIDFMVEFIPVAGRLMGIMSQELSEKYPNIGEKVGAYFGKWTSYLLDIVKQCKSQHASESDLDPETTMNFIVMTVEGAPIVKRQLGDAAVERAIKQLKHYLHSIFIESH